MGEEHLKALLLPEEQILWFKHQAIDYRRVFLFMICGTVGVIFLFAVFLWYVPNWTGIFYLGHTDIVVAPLVIYLGVLTSLTVPAIFIVYKAVTATWRPLRHVGLDLAELGHCHAVLALTNQRLIKGVLVDAKSQLISLPSLTVRGQEDWVSIPLTGCERAVVRRFLSWYTVSLFVHESGAESTSPIRQPIMTVRLTGKESDALLCSLQQFMPVIYQTEKNRWTVRHKTV